MAGSLKIKLQIVCGDEFAIGPGKADLLDAINKAGSISAGARAMGMSYRRAWLLVDSLNRCWAEPVVETVAGGSEQKGARLSPFGRKILSAYRALQHEVNACAYKRYESELAGFLRETPKSSQH